MKHGPQHYILGITQTVCGWSLIAFLVGMVFHASHSFNFGMLIVFAAGLLPLALVYFLVLLHGVCTLLLPPLARLMIWLGEEPTAAVPRSASSSSD